jgi:UDP:flavonoid glycosyltransferase YjiC (YdhE family)
MRAWNIGHALRALAPSSEVVVHARAAPPFASDDAQVRCVVASSDGPPVASFAPHVIVDDTMLPAADVLAHDGDALHAFIMRRCAAEEHAALLARPELARARLILIPHTEEEFAHALPTEIAARAIFTGPIVRSPDAKRARALRERYAPSEEDLLLVTTPGGGGFGAHADRFFAIAREVHRAVSSCAPRLRHVIVRGPRHAGALPHEPSMVVLDQVHDMPSLFLAANAVLSAGGYNSVQEIALAAVPAFFIASPRRLDDQWERIERVAARGGALAFSDSDDPAEIALAIASVVCDPHALAAMHTRALARQIVPGNLLAAERLLALLAP